tara:strand:- start:5004 stop:5234 length:231 start_codon:yes stop_codon:yes gene_type:complete
MIPTLLAALKALPRICDVLERLADVGTAYVAQQRKEEKDELVDDLVARAVAARDKRVHNKEVSRFPRDGGSSSEGV